MPGSGSRWPYVNAKRAEERAAKRIAELEARIERLEGQVRDLGAEPVA